MRYAIPITAFLTVLLPNAQHSKGQAVVNKANTQQGQILDRMFSTLDALKSGEAHIEEQLSGKYKEEDVQIVWKASIAFERPKQTYRILRKLEIDSKYAKFPKLDVIWQIGNFIYLPVGDLDKGGPLTMWKLRPDDVRFRAVGRRVSLPTMAITPDYNWEKSDLDAETTNQRQFWEKHGPAEIKSEGDLIRLTINFWTAESENKSVADYRSIWLNVTEGYTPVRFEDFQEITENGISLRRVTNESITDWAVKDKVYVPIRCIHHRPTGKAVTRQLKFNWIAVNPNESIGDRISEELERVRVSGLMDGTGESPALKAVLDQAP